MIIDFHTHAYTDMLAVRAKNAVPSDSPYAPSFDCTIDGLKKQMQECGIDKSVVLNISNKPENTLHVNDFAISLTKDASLIPFGSIHPYFDRYVDELNRIKDNGIKGIKFQPYTQKYRVNDSSAMKIYECALNMGFILMFHCGYDLMIPGDYGNVRDFASVASCFRGSKIIAAHLGGWKMWDDAIRLLPQYDIYVDCSFTIKFLPDAETYFASFNEDKILFGTDTPWSNPKDDIEDLKKLKLSAELKQKIFYKNALALLQD